jgi:2,3-dihydroxybiphenyl 1,2-dioxygenase
VDKVDELSYVGIKTGEIDAWSKYAVEVLGHQIAADSDDHNLYLRMDDHHHRLIVHRTSDGVEDAAYVGWQVRNAKVMNAVAARLEAHGVAVEEGSPEEAAARRVLGFVHFQDPHSGVQMELAYGPEITFVPTYRPSRDITGFVTGDMGLGHYVTYVPNVEAAEEFYSEVLGFATSDSPSIPGIGRVAAFMYCNSRHHSLAFFTKPEPGKRANHIMLEHSSIDDVGTAYDICRSHGSVKVELGRHNNDRMISFYAENPSGWLFELGWGARRIDPDTFGVEHYTLGGGSGAGEWGHEGLATII